jgi:peroxiredoxin
LAALLLGACVAAADARGAAPARRPALASGAHTAVKRRAAVAADTSDSARPAPAAVIDSNAPAASGAVRVAPMPDFTLPDLAGRPWRMSELDSMYCIVVYWSPECPECQLEVPKLAALAERHAGDQVRLVGIVDGRVEAQTMRFMREHGLSFTVLVDDGGHVADLLHADGTPMTWLVAGGIICFTNTGYDEALPEPLEAQLARVLPPRPPNPEGSR